MPVDTINDFNGDDSRLRPDDGEGFNKRRRLNTSHSDRAREVLAAEPNYGWTARATQIIRKMRAFHLIDRTTPFAVVDWLAKTMDKIYVYAGYGKAGQAALLMRRLNVGHIGIDAVLRAVYTELTNEHERQNKDVFWIFASAFLICFYEVKARKPFNIQYHHPASLVTEFLNLYPEFCELDAAQKNRLLTFHLVMQVAVSAFGGDDSLCLLELVTRMTEGREVALAVNKPTAMTFHQKMSDCLGTVNDCRRIIFERVYEVRRAAALAKERMGQLQRSNEKISDEEKLDASETDAGGKDQIIIPDENAIECV